jgi:ubiquinone/menaquinone biosynthesis C-methylase UbiE
MFNGKTLIDLGAGTGEHTVSVARWGAKCTLVDMNSDALEVAQKNFAQFVPDSSGHQFISESLYDIDLKNLAGNFDISHSRGVFTHVADKKKAFNILTSLAKPGGYVIYGDRNTAGGLQEMLQRLAIYKLGGDSDEKIVELAELLFSEDIDRSQRSVPRTREAIIFDRWVIQQQDDPSVEEVLDMFQNEGLEYVSSWPRIDFAGRGTSTFSDPRNWDTLKKGARLNEILWMVLNKGWEYIC